MGKVLILAFIFAIISAILKYYLLRLKFKEEDVLITVIIPCYNCRVDWLRETLTCINEQSIANVIEIVFIDDGSLLKGYASILKIYNRVHSKRYHRHTSNMGLASARNTGAVLAKGRYTVFLDPDDLMDSLALEKMYLKLIRVENNRIAFVYPAVVHFKHKPTDHISIERSPFDKRRLPKENYLTSFAMMDREFYLQVGGMCEDRIKHFEDYDFWLRISSLGFKGSLLDEPLFYYRRHVDGRSSIIRDSGVDFKSELLMNNPVSFGEMILDQDDSLSELAFPCLRPIPGGSLGIVGLWLWRHINFRLPFSWKYRKSSSYPLYTEIGGRGSVMFMVPWLEVGGADYYDLDILHALGNDYHKIIVTDVPRAKHQLLTVFKEAADEMFHLDTLTVGGGEDDLLEYFIRTRRVDIVYIRNSMTGYRLAERMKQQENMIKFVDVQHITGMDKDGWEYHSKAYVKFLDLRIAVSNHMKGVIEGIPPDGPQVFVVPPAVHQMDIVLEKCSHTKFRTVVFAGRMDDQKDPILWLDVAEALLLHDPSLLFLIMGEGELLAHVKHRISESAILLNSIHIQGFSKRSNVASLIAKGLMRDSNNIIWPSECVGSSVLLMTSRNEGCPMVVLEAAALGVPIVIADIGAVREIKEQIGNILFITPDRSVSSYTSWVLDALNYHNNTPSPPLMLEYSVESLNKRVKNIFKHLYETEN